MSENVVLDKIGLTAKAVLPKDAKVILFGSRARGDARADSDWDLLIILNKVNRDVDDINNYACPFMELGYEINLEINPIVYTTHEWAQRKSTVFRHFIEQEGIELCH